MAISVNTVERHAWPELKALSVSVFHAREVELVHENRFNCGDKACLDAVPSLLSKMKLLAPGGGYTIGRAIGETTIQNSPNHRILFFPLSIGPGRGSICSGELSLNGKVVKPGNYVEITRLYAVDALMDFLLVFVPESANANANATVA